MTSLEAGWRQIVSEGIEPLERFLDTGVAPYLIPVVRSSTDMVDVAPPKQKASIFQHRRYMALYS